ncbi:GNAT family N-acetyltransferase [Pedobacter polaris]|uniref:GNAT family N-acetyltransferase n=1 Tax=Pedobacter polaris TaxID=2571273 RepID=A0A4U1CWE7_9SPHI|nr:GNAT family N-acetyltransferase [Pedobacter polaris]TKC12595.1 GNAT family N-acetyltransferase [Pedobacter polaris]
MELTWVYKAFGELTTNELYSILQLRSEVFVVEQNCVYLDVDGKDKKSTHLMAWHNEDLVAYTRLVPQGISFKEASIGRVITSPFYRGLGIGITLLEKSITHTLETYTTNKIRIGAQLYLKKFYESFGFTAEGEEFLEDGIAHVEMVLER